MSWKPISSVVGQLSRRGLYQSSVTAADDSFEARERGVVVGAVARHQLDLVVDRETATQAHDGRVLEGLHAEADVVEDAPCVLKWS